MYRNIWTWFSSFSWKNKHLNNPGKSSTIKKKETCSFWLFIVYTVLVRHNKKQTWLIKLLFEFKREWILKNELWKKRNDTINNWRKKYIVSKKKCHIFKNRFSTDDDNKKSIINSEIIFTAQENIEELLIIFFI